MSGFDLLKIKKASQLNIKGMLLFYKKIFLTI